MLRRYVGGSLVAAALAGLVGCGGTPSPSKPSTATGTVGEAKPKGSGTAPIETIPPPPPRGK